MYINKIEYYNRKYDELNSDKSILLLQSKVDYLYDSIIQGRKNHYQLMVNKQLEILYLKY